MPKPSATIPLTIRLPRAIYDAVLQQAEAGNTSAADIIRIAVASYIEGRREDDRHAQLVGRLDAIDRRIGEGARWIVAQLAPEPVPTAAVSAAAHRPGPATVGVGGAR